MGSKGGNSSSNSSSGFSASTSTYTPNPEAMAAYRRALSMAENVTSQPYEPYQGQMIAGFTPDQMNAFQGVRNMQGIANPYLNSATQLQGQAVNYSDPRNFNQTALNQYMNPYQQSVVDATMKNLTQQQQEAMQGQQSKAALNGTFNGSGAYQGRAEVARQMGLANAQTLAGLNSSNYQQAMQQYNQQQQQAIQTAQNASYGLGQLGMQAQNSALTGLQALLSSGGQQQNLSQQQLTAAMQQWQAAKAYPYQQTAFYAGVAGGIAPSMGGTTNTMGYNVGNSQTQQSGGGGGAAGALTSLASLLPAMFGGSDEDDKTDIKFIGHDPESGEKLYEYRYKGDPKSYPKVVGPMAQDIEEHSPERVHEVGGHKIVAGLGHLPPSQRDHYAAGGAGAAAGTGQAPGADAAAQAQTGMSGPQQVPQTATGLAVPTQGFGGLPSNNDAAMSGFLSGVFDPRTADNMARSKWVNQDQGPDQNYAGDGGFSFPAGIGGNGAGFQNLTQPAAPHARGGEVEESKPLDVEPAQADSAIEKWINKAYKDEPHAAGLEFPHGVSGDIPHTLGHLSEVGAGGYGDMKPSDGAVRGTRAEGGGMMPGFGSLMRQPPYGASLTPQSGVGFIPNPADFGVTKATDHAPEITGKAAAHAIEEAQHAAKSASDAGHGGGGGGGGGGEGMKMPKPKKQEASGSTGAGEPATDPFTPASDAPASGAGAGAEPGVAASDAVPTAPEAPAIGNDLTNAIGSPVAPSVEPFMVLGGFLSKGGRVHRDGGGVAPGGAGAPGPGVGNGMTLGDAVLGDAASPAAAAGFGNITASQENLTGEKLLGKWNAQRHALHGTGPQLTPKQQGMPDMPDASFYQKPRADLPSVLETQHYGEQNPGLDTNVMAMAGAGHPGNLGQIAFMTAASSQAKDDAARGQQAQLKATREAMLNDPANFPVQGYYQSLGSNEVNPDTGLFNINYTGAYHGYPYKDGGRVHAATGASFSGGVSLADGKSFEDAYRESLRRAAPRLPTDNAPPGTHYEQFGPNRILIDNKTGAPVGNLKGWSNASPAAKAINGDVPQAAPKVHLGDLPAAPAIQPPISVAREPSAAPLPAVSPQGASRAPLSPEMRQHFANLERKYGLPPGHMTRMAEVESNYGRDADRPGSQYQGMFQMGRNERRAYGVRDAHDWRQNAEGAAALDAAYARQLEKSIGRPPTGGEIYLAHQQGPAGAAALINHPNLSAAAALRLAGVKNAERHIAGNRLKDMAVFPTADQFRAGWGARYGRAGRGLVGAPDTAVAQATGRPLAYKPEDAPGQFGPFRPGMGPSLSPLPPRPATPLRADAAAPRPAPQPGFNPVPSEVPPVTNSEAGMSPAQRGQIARDAARDADERRRNFARETNAGRGPLNEPPRRLPPASPAAPPRPASPVLDAGSPVPGVAANDRMIAKPPAARHGLTFADFNPIGSAHAGEAEPYAHPPTGGLTTPPKEAWPVSTDISTIKAPRAAGSADPGPASFGDLWRVDSPEPRAEGAPAEQRPQKEPEGPPMPQEAPKPEAAKQKYWGDWRDTEPFKSDPIGGFLDNLTGDTPGADKPGTIDSPMSPYHAGPDGAGLGALFDFSHGGRVRRAAGGPGGGGYQNESLGNFLERHPDLGDKIPPGGWRGHEPKIGDPSFTEEDRRFLEAHPDIRGERTGRAGGGPAGPSFYERWRTNPLSQGLYKAGLGMMGSKSTNTLDAMGEGAVAGANAYNSAMETARQNAANIARSGRADGGRMRVHRLDGGLTDDGDNPLEAVGSSLGELGDAIGTGIEDVGGAIGTGVGDIVGGLGNLLGSAEDKAPTTPAAERRAPTGVVPPAEAAGPEAADVGPAPARAAPAPAVAPAKKEESFFDRWANNPMSQALFTAGMGMMASPHTNVWQAIGEGGLRGVQALQTGLEGQREREAQQAEIDAANDFNQKMAEIGHGGARTGTPRGETSAAQGPTSQSLMNEYDRVMAIPAPGKLAALKNQKLAQLMSEIRMRRELEKDAAKGQPENKLDLYEDGVDMLGNKRWRYKSGPHMGDIYTPPGELSAENIDWSKTGEDFLKTIPERYRTRVREAAKGNIKIPIGIEGERLSTLAAQYDPTFDAGNFALRYDMKKAYQPEGKIGQQMSAASAALGHMGDMLELNKEMGNTRWPLLNKYKNEFTNSATGTDLLKRWNATKHVMAGEIAKYVKGGMPTEAEVRGIEETLDASSSPEQLVGVLHEYAEKMATKTRDYVYDWNLQFENEKMPPRLKLNIPKMNKVTQRLDEEFKQYHKDAVPVELIEERHSPVGGQYDVLPMPKDKSELKPGLYYERGSEVWTFDGSKMVRVQ